MRILTIFILALGSFYILSGNSYSIPLPFSGESGVVKYNKTKSFDGYNFYQNNRGYAYLMDMNGHLIYRWKFPNSDENWGYARLLDNGDIIKICCDRYLAKFDKNSKLIWKIPLAVNHDIEVLPDGSFLAPVFESPVEYNNREVIFDSIVHISKDGQKLGTWSTYEHLKELQKFHPPSDLDKKPAGNIAKGLDLDEYYHLSFIHMYQYYHLNSIQILPDTPLGLKNKIFQKGNCLICLRNVDLMLILDKDTHQVVWSWGSGELDRPHTPRMLDNGNILVFDNGLHRTYSRLVIVNPVSRKIVWEYKASPPEKFYSRTQGSGQLLANGNFLICETKNGRAFEITPGGEIVWEFLNPELNMDGSRATIYRMLRISKKEVSGWLRKAGPHSYPFLQHLAKIPWEPFMARIQEKRYNQAPLLKNVVIYDKNRSFQGYNLLITGDTTEATLMDMNGKRIYQWHYPSASLPIDRRPFPNLWTKACILKNGGLLALVPYGGLLKIDKKSNLLWFKRIACHHDFDIDSNGNIYTITKSRDNGGIQIDSIMILSPKGETKKEISLYDLFKKYPSFLPYINKISIDAAFQSTSIQILDGKWTFKIPAFKKGDLLISMGNLGVIICVDPDKEKIVWLMDTLFCGQGQHFAKLLDRGNILIFDNLYRSDLSRVVEYDPSAKKIVWEYSGQNGRFYSPYFGQCYRLPNGNTLIVESLSGHCFEVTPEKKIVWEFYDPDQIDKDNEQFIVGSNGHLQGHYDKMIAVIRQMQRIPIDSTLDWLKN